MAAFLGFEDLEASFDIVAGGAVDHCDGRNVAKAADCLDKIGKEAACRILDGSVPDVACDGNHGDFMAHGGAADGVAGNEEFTG